MTMNAAEFVSGIKSEVQDSAVRETIDLLTQPPGRSPSLSLLSASAWFKSLSSEDQQQARQVLAIVSRSAVFGLLCVLDGVRTLEESNEKGIFELLYKNGADSILLNSPKGPMLHELL